MLSMKKGSTTTGRLLVIIFDFETVADEESDESVKGPSCLLYCLVVVVVMVIMNNV